MQGHLADRTSTKSKQPIQVKVEYFSVSYLGHLSVLL